MVDRTETVKYRYNLEYDASKIIEEIEEYLDVGNLLFVDATVRYIPLTDDLIWIISIGYTNVDGIPRTKEYYVIKKVYDKVMRFIKSKIPKK